MTEQRKTTCGVIYRDMESQFATSETAAEDAFSAGFVAGQAEKVYLGACMAAMFRPSPEKRKRLVTIVDEVAMRYGLLVTTLDDEIWMVRDGIAAALIEQLRSTERNSILWHSIRAKLCGVPPDEVDFRFHERRGYGERCD